MLPGSLGALPKVGGDGKKTETPDKRRVHPKNTWTNVLLPEPSNVVRRKKQGIEEGGVQTGSREVTLKWHS